MDRDSRYSFGSSGRSGPEDSSWGWGCMVVMVGEAVGVGVGELQEGTGHTRKHIAVGTLENNFWCREARVGVIVAVDALGGLGA